MAELAGTGQNLQLNEFDIGRWELALSEYPDRFVAASVLYDLRHGVDSTDILLC